MSAPVGAAPSEADVARARDLLVRLGAIQGALGGLPGHRKLSLAATKVEEAQLWLDSWVNSATLVDQ